MLKEGAEEVQDSSEFYQELEEQELATLKKHIRNRKSTRGSKGNSTEALYKEALLDYMFGRFQEASKKLKHMITIAPDNSEPYHLLGNMHQENGQLDKAAEYLFMSTYLSPPSLEKWLKVGQLSFQRKMYNQAAYCFGRALKIAPCDPKIMVRRAEAFDLAAQSKKAINTYKRLLTISQAPQYIKKYAKLRYKRGEYSFCRDVLQQIEGFITDIHLIYMICETHLQEHSYNEAAKLLEKHLEIRSQSMQEEEMLPAEFIVILFICSVVLRRECYGFSSQTLLEQIKGCYSDQYAQLYNQALTHISKHPTSAFELTHFLLKYPQHQTVNNYLMVIDHLCRQKQPQCLDILNEAIKKHPNTRELTAERDYVHKCFGIGDTLREPDAIFHSDSDQPVPEAANLLPQRRIKESTNFQVIETLIQNVEEGLRILIEQLNQGSLPGVKEQQGIIDGLQLFISLAPGGKQDDPQQKQGLYIKKTSKKRPGDCQSKANIMNDHIPLMMRYFQNLVTYLQGLLSNKQWKKLIQIGEKVSKVHVFKNYSKLTDFIALKIRIYEMCVLSCLAASKFSTCLFFLRFLVTKHPEDSLYSLAMHLLLRICPKKTFVCSALSKRFSSPGGQRLARLLAMQYMETGCFELAVGAILKSAHQQPLGPTPQLCLAACLIQIASSRNTYNKLDFVNRSALCLASYESVNKNQFQTLFNRGRWYAQIKLNHKAIICFQKLLDGEAIDSIKQRAAYCLLSIYRQCDQYQKADRLSAQYFPIPPEIGQIEGEQPAQVI